MINQKQGQRLGASYIDEDRTVKVRCKFNCGVEITFSYNSVGRNGRKIPCNLDGTAHRCARSGVGE